MELTESQEQRVRVLMTVQVALLGEVHPSVRKVGVGWTDKSIRVLVFHDGEPSEDQVESASCIETEIMASFPAHEVEVSTVRLDRPGVVRDIDGISAWAYSRWEPDAD